VLAQLLSHRVALNIAPLYAEAPAPPARTVAAPQPAAPARNGHVASQSRPPAGGNGHAAETARHLAFLSDRRESLHLLDQQIQQSLADVRQSLAPEPTPAETTPPAAAAPGPTEPVSAPAAPAPPATPPPPRTDVLIDEGRVRAFTLGAVSECFGPEYRVVEGEGRRTPCIPNSELQLMSRVVRVEGQRHEFKPGTLMVSEYDVPADAWYYQHNAYPTLPYSLLMEIALQPCGFLSAYLGSVLLFPDADLYFRNLDGRGQTGAPIDIRGQRLTHQTRLVSSTFIRGIIIQKFDFQFSCAGQMVYEGNAVFGYFTHDALLNQMGLDNGRSVPPWYEQQGHSHLSATMVNLRSQAGQALYQAPPGKPHYRLSHEHLDLLDSVMIVEGGGQHGQGYLYASKRMDPDAWFFRCHFKDDPVMPGSLGVEGMVQALQVYALKRGLGSQFASPHFDYVPDHETTWRYRGQIVREVGEWSLEVHISRVDVGADEVRIVGDGCLWRGNLRIYDVQQVSLRITETRNT
jgi:3-hydroxymyristoyl/3-hydroxydecanoyl-(acyl carrier protein) dehydratase